MTFNPKRLKLTRQDCQQIVENYHNQRATADQPDRLTQRGIAEIMGVSQGTIQRILNGTFGERVWRDRRPDQPYWPPQPSWYEWQRERQQRLALQLESGEVVPV